MSKLHNQNVLDTLDARQVNDTQLHYAMVRLYREASKLSKRDIVHSNELATVFSHPVIARQYMRQIVTWTHEHTPIRIKFKDNGQFEKIGFARAGEWLLDEMENSRWYNYEKATTKKAAQGSIERALKAMAREVARTAYDDNMEVARHVNRAGELVNKQLMTMVIEELQSEKFNTWAGQRDAEKLAASRNATPLNDAVAEYIREVA